MLTDLELGGGWGMSAHPGTAEPLATSTPPVGAHSPAPTVPAPQPCPFLPAQLLMHFSEGKSHHCLVSLLLINNLVWFANNHKVFFKDATFGTLDIAHHLGYRGSSRGLPNVASKPAVGY